MANYRFGTWNIGTLKGKSGEVCKVLHRRKVKVCCIQEVRWKGEGSRSLQGYKLIWKRNSEGTAGVGVLVASELADRIIRVQRISDRVIAVDLVIGEQIVKVVMGYVVTSTLFKKRQSHLVTYESGGNKTAVDMILIKREHKKRIMNTIVIPGEECVHGHHLVVMDMHLKVMKYRKNHQGLHKWTG